jgi:hypothetical protein
VREIKVQSVVHVFWAQFRSLFLEKLPLLALSLGGSALTFAAQRSFGAVVTVLLEAIKSPQTQFTSDPRRIVESTAKLQDYQVKLGALAKAAPLDGLFALSVYDRALASN